MIPYCIQNIKKEIKIKTNNEKLLLKMIEEFKLTINTPHQEQLFSNILSLTHKVGYSEGTVDAGGENFKSECWNFKESLALWMLPRLEYLKETTEFHPSNTTHEDWTDTLSQICSHLTIYLAKLDSWYSDTKYENYQFALELIKKNIRHLWD